MSTRLESRAEVVKLAALLGVDESRLAYLEPLPAPPLRALRRQVTDELYDDDADSLDRLASAARIVPAAIAGPIAQRVIRPVLAARLAARLDPARAADMSRRTSPEYLADIATVIDPRRAQAVLAAIPIDAVKAVAPILIAREAYVAMGRFVAYVDVETIAAVLPLFSERALLHIAFVLENPERMEPLIGLLPERRMRRVVRTAASEQLWPEALGLLEHLGDETRGALADLAADEDDRVLTGMIEAAHEQGLWESVLPTVRTMSPPARRRFAALEVFHQPGVLDAIVRAAAEHALWTELLPLVALLDEEGLAGVAETALTLDTDVIVAAVESARVNQLYAPVVVLAAAMGDRAPWELVDLLLGGEEHELDALLNEVADAGLWADVLRIAERVPAETVARLAARASKRDELDALVGRVLAAADQHDLWDEGLAFFARLDEETLARVAEPAARLAPRLRARVARRAVEGGLLERLGPLATALTA